MAILEVGEYVKSISAVIEAAKASGILPSGVVFGPKEYHNFLFEVNKAKMENVPIPANRGSINGVKVFLSPTSGIDLIFGVETHERLLQNLEEKDDEHA